jgi:hypothetical protein
MAADGFKSAGLGLMNMADEYARKGMTSSGNRGGEFLGGLLSFLGVGQDTQQNLQNTIKDFKTNPIAALGPKITSDMYGVSPNAMGPAMPPMASQSVAVPPVSGVGQSPVTNVPATIDPLEQQRLDNQKLINNLIPRNL